MTALCPGWRCQLPVCSILDSTSRRYPHGARIVTNLLSRHISSSAFVALELLDENGTSVKIEGMSRSVCCPCAPDNLLDK